jgi:group I intron endonuclease
LAERIRQHIKCGIGIDTPNNKLYNAMMKYGVENYSFEVVEECSREELNKREAFWIEFYHSQDFGYNMTKGNTRN